jgi:hypothetical protein
MKTMKDILTENRESVISSIKFVFKIWKAEDLKVKMVEFLDFANTNYSVDSLINSDRVKTDLKYMVQKMKISQKTKTDKRKWYEIAEDIADQRGLSRCSRTGIFTDINGKVVNI